MKKIAFALAALGSVMLADVATAAPIITDSVPTAHSIAEKTYYRRWHHRWYGPRYYGAYGSGWGYGYGGCYAARHLCADRWGWGGPGFRRCLWRHGC